MSESVNIREIVLNLLEDIQKTGRPLQAAIHQALMKYQYLDKKDRSFISRVTRGTIEEQIYLDNVLSQFSSVKLSKIKPVIKMILRMSAYQLLKMDNVPAHAVCNEAVKLASRRGFYGLKGFVNGVLRNIDRNRDCIKLPDMKKEPVSYLSVVYSMPEWIIRRWLEDYDFETVRTMLSAMLKEQKVTVRINTDKISVPEFFSAVGKEREVCFQSSEKDGILAKPGRYAPFAARLSAFNHLNSLEIFNRGFCFVQDESSMLSGLLAGIQKGDKIIDVCAAPGGKSMNAALLGGSVCARDISEAKTEKITENLLRTGIQNIEVNISDAAVFHEEDKDSADIVIADVPCSGLGILGKKADIKYRLKESDIQSLVQLQRRILANAWQYVKPGGILMYSTCTISREENIGQLKWLLKEFPLEAEDFSKDLPAALRETLSEDAKHGFIQLLPGIHDCDGFFIAKLKRRKN